VVGQSGLVGELSLTDLSLNELKSASAVCYIVLEGKEIKGFRTYGKIGHVQEMIDAAARGAEAY